VSDCTNKAHSFADSLAAMPSEDLSTKNRNMQKPQVSALPKDVPAEPQRYPQCLQIVSFSSFRKAAFQEGANRRARGLVSRIREFYDQ
jgi:hypothetical protein